MNSRDEQSGNGWGSFVRTRTEQESTSLYEILDNLFEKVEKWYEEIADPLTVLPGSALDIANQLTEPFQVAHSLGYLRLTAVDHAHAVRTLLQEAKAQHVFAPFSLLRSSIENAAVALWVVNDSSPRSIAIRTLKLEWANIRDRANAYKTVGAPDSDMEQRKQNFLELLIRNGLQKENIRANPPGMLSMINEASETFDLGNTPALMWQMCSGATHGRNWISGFLTMMEAENSEESKILSGRLTSDEQGIVLATYAACDLIDRLFQVLSFRSIPEGYSGKSFVQANKQLLSPTYGLFLPAWMRK